MPSTQPASWTIDTKLTFDALCVGIFTLLSPAIWTFWKWLQNRSAKLKAELSIHIVSDPVSHIAIGNGVKVRLVHRGGKPIKIQDVYLRVKGVDLTGINQAWSASGGLGIKVPPDIPPDRTWLGVRLYRMKTNNVFIRHDLDAAIDFSPRHEESYFTAVPISPDGLNQLFLDSPSEKVELAATGPDDDIVLKRGFELQEFLRSLTKHFPGFPINSTFPTQLALRTTSLTPPNITAVGSYNDRSIHVPPPKLE